MNTFLHLYLVVVVVGWSVKIPNTLSISNMLVPSSKRESDQGFVQGYLPWKKNEDVTRYKNAKILHLRKNSRG